MGAVWRGKIAIVTKDESEEANQTRENARSLITVIAARVPHASGVHEAEKPGRIIDNQTAIDTVYVIYGDEGDVRTIVETLDTHSMIGDYLELFYGYVSLPLWREYSTTAQAQIKAELEQQAEHRTKVGGDL